MKKILLVSIGSCLFLAISSVAAYFLRYSGITQKWAMLGIGVGILALSGILAIFAKERTPLNVVCFILSGIALGFCIRGWYIFRKFDNGLPVMLLVSVACVAYLWVFYLLLYIPFLERHVTAYLLTYVSLSLVGYILVMAFTKTTYVSTFGYYMIVEIAFMFALCCDAYDMQELIRLLTISTYSVLIVAVIIALMMLGGDGFDLDGDIFSGLSVDSPRQKKVRRKR